MRRPRSGSFEVKGLSLLLLLCSVPSASSFGATTVKHPPTSAASTTKLQSHGGLTEGRKSSSPSGPSSSSSSPPSSSSPSSPRRVPSPGRRQSKTRLDAYRPPAVLEGTSPRRGGDAAIDVIDLTGVGVPLLSTTARNSGSGFGVVVDKADTIKPMIGTPAPTASPDSRTTPSQVACLLHQAVRDVSSLKSHSINRRDVDRRQALFQEVQHLVSQSQDMMQSMNPETVATVLNSLSKLPPHLLRDLPMLSGGRGSPFWSALFMRMHTLVPRFGPRCTATTINALAKLRALVGPAMVPMDRVLIRRMSEQCRKHFGTEEGFTTQGLSNVINGFAKLGFHPGRPWLRDFCQEVTNQIDDMGPQAIANVINGLGKLKYRPTEAVLQVLAARSHSILIQFNPQGLSNLLNGFARLSPPFHPGSAFLDDLRDASLWRLTGFESRGLAALAHGFSTFGYHPGEVFLDSFGEAMTRALEGKGDVCDEITGWTLCTTYNGLGKLGWRPPAGAAGFWTATQKWMNKCGGAARALEPQQVSQLLWSLSAMGPPPEAEALFEQLLHEAAVIVKRGEWENGKADRQFRQVVLFCHLVGSMSLRPAATELKQALEAAGRMVGSNGRICCEEDGNSSSNGKDNTPMSSYFHMEVLRSVTESLGAWDPTTEVDDGVYIQDIVLRCVKLDGMASSDKSLLPVIIEVDGPAHFFINSVRRPRGDHCLKARILKAQTGWTHAGVVSVAWFEWAGSRTKEERARLIHAKLEKVVGQENLGAYIDASRNPFQSSTDMKAMMMTEQLRREQEEERRQQEEEALMGMEDEDEEEGEDGLAGADDDDEDVVLDAAGNVRSRRGLWGLTVVELKSMLRVRGMAVSGRKADLVDRLEASGDLSLLVLGEEEDEMVAVAAAA